MDVVSAGQNVPNFAEAENRRSHGPIVKHASSNLALPGALVISLDFELHWGVRDHHPARGPYLANLLGARSVIPRLLDMFEEFDTAATWATVGFLFAENRDDLSRFRPSILPHYEDRALFPYEESIGQDEGEDPLHFAPSLIDMIGKMPRQEIATHTYSHYFCGEAGQTKSSFEADIGAAVAIAASRGIQLRSIVFPRNQFNPEYSDVLVANGITAFRGNPRNWMWQFENNVEGKKWWRRVGRFADAYVPLGGSHLVAWDSILQSNGLCDVRASHVLKPYQPNMQTLSDLHIRRIREAIRSAAETRRICHLWWHPHNFGRFQDHNLRMLRAVLEELTKCRARYSMRSLNMNEVDAMVRTEFEDANRSYRKEPGGIER